MGLSTKTPIAEVVLEIQKGIEDAKEIIAEELARVGEIGTNEARMSGSYTDRTGNLRSSIGYVLAKEGAVLTSGEFAKVIGKENKTGSVSGDKVGRQTATDSAKELSRDGYALVLVAGMEYASNVADRGYNVLDSAELEIRRRLDTRFKNLGFGVGKTMYKSREENK